MEETSVIATQQWADGLSFNEANEQDTKCFGGLVHTNRFEERTRRAQTISLPTFMPIGTQTCENDWAVTGTSTGSKILQTRPQDNFLDVSLRHREQLA